jgi:hypothetical protein
MENKEDLKNDLDEEFRIFVETETEPDHFRYIYKILWFETKRHKKPYTTMYMNNAEDTKWVFDTLDWYNGVVRVEFLKVCRHSNEYSSACLNSTLHISNGLRNNEDDEELPNTEKEAKYF